MIRRNDVEKGTVMNTDSPRRLSGSVSQRFPPTATPYDVMVIGGGINGAGVARDAARRGLKVLLLDKGDLSSGTTSWSTRLIHGGLRYLEHGELTLVRESLHERELLLRNAPHLVRPLSMLIPIYKDAARGPFTLRAGMIAYDLLSLDKSLDHHRMLSREEALRRAPALNPSNLRGAALYFDAQVEFAERLVLENALDARAHGARILTYARAEKIIVENNTVRGLEFTDLIGGASQTAQASVVLNVAGPWVDEVLSASGRSTKPLVGGTKGSHIVVEKFAGAPDCAIYAEARADHRPFFIIPWNELYLIGTTDILYAGNLDRVEAGDGEIEYLIKETNRVIPSAELTRGSVLYTYSGVRPLPFVEKESESSITRRHFVRDHAPEIHGLLSIVGGKLTTYRSLSEEAVNLIFKKLGRAPARSTTAHTPLPGAKDFYAFAEHFKKTSGLFERIAERLLRIYGTRAGEVLEMAGEDEELKQPFSAESDAIGAEVLMSFRREMAETLTDCLMRRTLVGLGRACGLDADMAAAKIAVKFLGWSDARASREIEAYRKYLERFHPREMTEKPFGHAEASIKF